MVSINLKLLDSDREIQRAVNKALQEECSRKLRRAAVQIKGSIKPIIESALASSPEIQSLSGGVLQAEFGLESNPANQIISAVSSSIDVRVDKVTSNLNGGITLTIQPSDFSNLLSLPAASQPIDGGSIPWLEWLLTAGDSIIIANFGVEFGDHGRTGKARMSKKFSPYKVNSAFSGTADNNFITRAIGRNMSKIQDVIRRAL